MCVCVRGVCVCVCVCVRNGCVYGEILRKSNFELFYYISAFHLQELVKLILQTHYETVQYETTDNLLSETEFEALCSGHAAYRQHIEVALIRDGKLQIATRDNDRKV